MSEAEGNGEGGGGGWNAEAVGEGCERANIGSETLQCNRQPVQSLDRLTGQRGKTGRRSRGARLAALGGDRADASRKRAGRKLATGGRDGQS